MKFKIGDRIQRKSNCIKDVEQRLLPGSRPKQTFIIIKANKAPLFGLFGLTNGNYHVRYDGTDDVSVHSDVYLERNYSLDKSMRARILEDILK